MSTRFVIINQIDTSVLWTIPDTLSTLPIDNVKKLSKSLVSRSVYNTPYSIYGIFSQTTIVNSFIICGHNFTEGTIIILELFSDISFDISSRVYLYGGVIQAYNSTITGDMVNFPIWLDSPVSVSSFKLSIYNSYLYPMDYFQIYRLFCGEYLQSTIGAALQNVWYIKDNSEQYRTEAGSLRTEILTTSKVIEFNLNNIREIERSKIIRELAMVGKRKEFYISIFKNSCQSEKEVDYSGVVKLTKIPKFTEIANDIYTNNITVEEV